MQVSQHEVQDGASQNFGASSIQQSSPRLLQLGHEGLQMTMARPLKLEAHTTLQVHLPARAREVAAEHRQPAMYGGGPSLSHRELFLGSAHRNHESSVIHSVQDCTHPCAFGSLSKTRLFIRGDLVQRVLNVSVIVGVITAPVSVAHS